ncbi:MAG TPA: hypothetical protein VKW04_09085 [Planctomycetota bacterium]|nr:hypothetical protein [Planctomycetota bacterium]
MGKIAFVLGAVGSLVLGLVLSSRLVHRDYSASIVNKLGTHTTCPTFWVSWDKPPDVVPDGLLTCACPVPAQPEASGTPMHPPKDVHDAAAPMDVMSISFTEFTPLSGAKKVGLSYVLARGSDRQTFVISPASDPYLSFALATALPLIGGIVLGILLGLIPKKKSA